MFEDRLVNNMYTERMYDYDEVYHVERAYIPRPGDKDLNHRYGITSLRPRCYNFQMQYYTCLRTARIPTIQCMLYAEDLKECRYRLKEVRA